MGWAVWELSAGGKAFLSVREMVVVVWCFLMGVLWFWGRLFGFWGGGLEGWCLGCSRGGGVLGVDEGLRCFGLEVGVACDGWMDFFFFFFL